MAMKLRSKSIIPQNLLRENGNQAFYEFREPEKTKIIDVNL